MKATFPKNRLEAFTDGVLAIVITIMVLELKLPQHADQFADLAPVLPVFLSYVLSFVYVGIYWNNHHHMLHATREITGGILWANLVLLFCLSLIPFVTSWIGENPFAAAPTALYGLVLLLSAIAYRVLQTLLLRVPRSQSILAKAVGKDLKGSISVMLYVLAIGLAFVIPWLSAAIYVAVAMIWLVPDRRIERALAVTTAEADRKAEGDGTVETSEPESVR
jgi:uncharacterized membrane protein